MAAGASIARQGTETFDLLDCVNIEIITTPSKHFTAQTALPLQTKNTTRLVLFSLICFIRIQLADCCCVGGGGAMLNAARTICNN